MRDEAPLGQAPPGADDTGTLNGAAPSPPVARAANEARISPMEAAAKLAAGQALLVDVVQTTPGTGLESARPVAYRLPPEELDQRWQELPRAREIIAYCTDPHEATSACVAQYLRERGYRAHALAGGFAAWRDEGFPRLQRLLEGPA